MEKTKVLLVITQSPPPNLDDQGLETYYDRSTKPLLMSLYKNKDVLVSLYFTGSYLLWLKSQHTESISVIREMIGRKQVEILGGGYSNPVLPLIPHNDRLGQLELLSTTVRQIVGKRPRGCWLAKGIWENTLTVPLATSGLDFTFLETEAFRRLGLKGAQLQIPRNAESQGRSITVIPFDAEVSLRLLSGDLEYVRGILEKAGELGTGILSLVVPCETSASTEPFFNPQFIESLFQLFRDHLYTAELITPAFYFRKTAEAFPVAYFSNSTFSDLVRMGAEPLYAKESVLKHYRQCFSEISEVGYLYSKMIQVHLLAYQIRGDRYRRKNALEELWKAQNYQYFYNWKEGGVLDPINRQSAYRSLLESEVICRDKAKFASSIQQFDVNFDGVKETLFQGKLFNFSVSHRGACLYALEDIKHLWNYSDTLKTYFQNDWPLRARASFMDRFMEVKPGADLMKGFGDLSDWDRVDFRNTEFKREEKSLVLVGVGTLKRNHETHSLKLKKEFLFREAGIEVQYELETLSAITITILFGVEFNFSFPQTHAVEVVVPGHDKNVEPWEDRSEVRGFDILDRAQGVCLSIETQQPGDLSWAPLKSDLPDGQVIPYGHTFLPRWKLTLEQGQPCKFSVNLTLSQIHR